MVGPRRVGIRITEGFPKPTVSVSFSIAVPMTIKPKIKAKDLVQDIRSRMTDAQLMAKYRVSIKGLQSIFRQLLDTNAITQAELDARRGPYKDTVILQRLEPPEMVRDIRSGMTDFELMEKHDLSPRGLQRAFDGLLQSGEIDQAELDSRLLSYDSVTVQSLRNLPRYFLAVAVDVFELGHPETKGVLRDITENGVGIAGIKAKPGTVKTFTIPSENFIDEGPILFDAKCVWATPQSWDQEAGAGFQIVKISEKSLQDLRELIRSLALNI